MLNKTKNSDNPLETNILDETKSNPSANELAEEVLNLRRHKKVLENRVRDVEIENISLQQKAYPNSSLLRGHKKYLDGGPINPLQYSKAISMKPQGIQKLLSDIRGDTPSVNGMNGDPNMSPVDRLLENSFYTTAKTDLERLTGDRAMSPVRDRVNPRMVGHYLPKLRDYSQDQNGEGMSNSALDSSPLLSKKNDNVWLSGFLQKRAHSTLRRLKSGSSKNVRNSMTGDKTQDTSIGGGGSILDGVGRINVHPVTNDGRVE